MQEGNQALKKHSSNQIHILFKSMMNSSEFVLPKKKISQIMCGQGCSPTCSVTGVSGPPSLILGSTTPFDHFRTHNLKRLLLEKCSKMGVNFFGKSSFLIFTDRYWGWGGYPPFPLIFLQAIVC